MNPLFFLLSFLFIFYSPHCLKAIAKEDIDIIPYEINQSDQRKCYLSICMIFRDEADYLKEWIEFHRLVGVSHFYLYNNCSKDHYLKVLKPYIKNGIVELFDVPFDSSSFNDHAKTHNFVQVCCYNHAIKLAKKKSSWIAIIDSDEFICPVKDKTVSEALQRYSYASGVAVYWQIYGTSNVWDLKPNELMIEKLLYKAPNNTNKNQFKSIVRPNKAKKCVDPHWTKVSGKMVFVNHDTFTHTPIFHISPIDYLRINHYTMRTGYFYENFKKPRRAQWGCKLPSPEYEKIIMDLYNTEYDPIMLRFTEKLKRRMKE